MTQRISAGVLVEQDDRILLVRYGRLNCWVAPGGIAQGTERLRDTARRETHAATGLDVEVRELMYIEEFHSPDVRYCKFWFAGWLLGGSLSIGSPEAQSEGIVEAAWLSRAEFADRLVFPSVLGNRYWTDRMQKPRVPVHLAEVRTMDVW